MGGSLQKVTCLRNTKEGALEKEVKSSQGRQREAFQPKHHPTGPTYNKDHVHWGKRYACAQIREEDRKHFSRRRDRERGLKAPNGALLTLRLA